MSNFRRNRARCLSISGGVLILVSCYMTPISEDEILVTNDGITGVLLGHTISSLLKDDVDYLIWNAKVISPYGLEFMRIWLMEDQDTIAYLNYDEATLDSAKVSSIVCVHSKCRTQNGLFVGDNFKKLRDIYPEQEIIFRSGSGNKGATGYFIPDDLKKRSDYFVLSKVVIKLEKVGNDTLITALISETN